MRPLIEAVGRPGLLAFRVALRRFSRWTEDQARSVGVTPGQHQLMLCVRGSTDVRGPPLAELLQPVLDRHPDAVG